MSEFRFTGAYYGYPPCCVDSFVADFEWVQSKIMERAAEALLDGQMAFFDTPYHELAGSLMEKRRNGRHSEDKPWGLTGFIPCAKCAVEAEKDFPAWVAKNITPGRTCPEEFPNG